MNEESKLLKLLASAMAGGVYAAPLLFLSQEYQAFYGLAVVVSFLARIKLGVEK